MSIYLFALLFHANSNFVFEIDYFLSSPWQKAPRHSSGDASRPSCDAPRSNMSNVLPRRALSTGRSTVHDATRAALGATRGFTMGFQPAFLTTRRSKHTIQPPGLRCACSPCSTYLSSTSARAKRLAPRPDGPLTHFASPRGEKYRLTAFFSLRIRQRSSKVRRRQAPGGTKSSRKAG